MRKSISGILPTLLLASTLMLAFDIHPVKAIGIIYIMADGSIDPPTAPISSLDNVTYTFTGNISDSVVVLRDNILIDGAGFTVHGEASGVGIDMSYRTNVTLKCTILENFNYGVLAMPSSNITILENRAVSNKIGIFLRFSSNGTIIGNSAFSSNHTGIYLQDSSNNIIARNNASFSKDFYGIHTQFSNNNTITGNNASSNKWAGISLSFSNNNNITDNNAKDSWHGVYVGVSCGNIISGNKVSNHSVGIGIYQNSNNNLLVNNQATNNNWGIDLQAQSTDNILTCNNASSNIQNGIRLIYSNNNNVSGNWAAANGQNGIQLGHSSNNTLSRNNISFDYWGVNLDGSPSNSISENNITNCYSGIWLSNSSQNTILGNLVANHSYSAPGIFVAYSSNNNLVKENNVTMNKWIGIGLWQSSNNTISENNLTANHHGFSYGQSPNNSIYHNNFIHNDLNFYDTGDHEPNTWDKGYPSGGNYWSDYAGVDLFRGPSQNITGSDGIGDAPYVIDENNRDSYPLMNPWTPPVHDIAIATVTLSKTVVGQGYSLSMNLTVANEGDFTETFNVTVYANTTMVEMKEITLTSRNFTIVTFTWSTTGLAKGNYTMSAVADTVSGEVDIADNDFTDGWIVVAMIGDITGPDGWPDGKCDIRDIGLVAKYFGQNVPPAPANCDVTGQVTGVPDGKIDIRDVAIVAKEFGKVDP